VLATEYTGLLEEKKSESVSVPGGAGAGLLGLGGSVNPPDDLLGGAAGLDGGAVGRGGGFLTGA